MVIHLAEFVYLSFGPTACCHVYIIDVVRSRNTCICIHRLTAELKQTVTECQLSHTQIEYSIWSESGYKIELTCVLFFHVHGLTFENEKTLIHVYLLLHSMYGQTRNWS